MNIIFLIPKVRSYIDISSSLNDNVLSQRDFNFSLALLNSSIFNFVLFNFIISSNSHKFSLSKSDLYALSYDSFNKDFIFSSMDSRALSIYFFALSYSASFMANIALKKFSS